MKKGTEVMGQGETRFELYWERADMFGALREACLAANDRLDLSCAVYTEQGGQAPDSGATSTFLTSQQNPDFKDGRYLRFSSQKTSDGPILNLAKGPLPAPRWHLDITGPFDASADSSFSRWTASINLEVAYGTYEPLHYIHLMRPFLQAVLALLKPTFAFSCHDWSEYRLYALEEQLAARADRKVEALPWWLYWETMVFGPPLVASFGLERLLSTPAHRVDKLGDDVVWIEDSNGLGNDHPSLILVEPDTYDVDGLYYVGQGELENGSVKVVDRELRLLRIPTANIRKLDDEGGVFVDKPTVADYLEYPYVHPARQLKNVSEHLGLFSFDLGDDLENPKFPFYELVTKHSGS